MSKIKQYGIDIPRNLGDKSTVSRELKRNSTANGKYVWDKVHDTTRSRKRCTPGNRGPDSTLKWRIMELIKAKQWFPRQISGRLQREK